MESTVNAARCGGSPPYQGAITHRQEEKMTNEVMALKRHQTTVIGPTNNLLLVSMTILCVNALRRIAYAVADEELKERLEIAGNGLDGIAFTMRRKLGIKT
jgi:hypothetical protein